MKAHKHKDVIIAWANGAEVEFRNKDSKEWVFTEVPRFNLSNDYRVKPREFRVGAWHPVVSNSGRRYILEYANGRFEDFYSGLDVNNCKWIGEELGIEWPDNG